MREDVKQRRQEHSGLVVVRRNFLIDWFYKTSLPKPKVRAPISPHLAGNRFPQHGETGSVALNFTSCATFPSGLRSRYRRRHYNAAAAAGRSPMIA